MSSFSTVSPLAREVLDHLQVATNEQLSDVQLCSSFTNKSKPELVSAINELLTMHRLELLQTAAGSLVYKLVSADTAEKFAGLTKEQKLVYQTCEKAGNKVRNGSDTSIMQQLDKEIIVNEY